MNFQITAADVTLMKAAIAGARPITELGSRSTLEKMRRAGDEQARPRVLDISGLETSLGKMYSEVIPRILALAGRIAALEQRRGLPSAR